MYKLKINDYGHVNYLMRTGKDLVKSHMSPMAAQHIIDNGTETKTVDKNYLLAIDDKWFFEATPVKRKSKGANPK